MPTLFDDTRWYKMSEAIQIMKAFGVKVSRTTLYRRIKSGAIKPHTRRNFPGTWFKGRDLNLYYSTKY